MTIFTEMFTGLLPTNSNLQNINNPLRKVLDKSIGEYFDSIEPIYEQLFLTDATGSWLDVHGRDYGIARKLDEDDDSYRERIIYEKLDHLTVSLLNTVYNMELYAFVSGFNPAENYLTSDNPYIASKYMSIANKSTRDILSSKFILDSGIVWLDETNFGNPNKIINIYNEDVLENYISILSNINLDNFFELNHEIEEIVLVLDRVLSCKSMFWYCSHLSSVDLDLPNATECRYLLRYCSALISLNLNLSNAIDCLRMLEGCSALTSVALELPNAINCEGMFWDCSALTNINLNLPNATNCRNMFLRCSSLTNINLKLPNAINCIEMMFNCSSLTSIDLNLPNATECSFMLFGCTSLESVKLKLPNLTEYTDIFYQCSNIETIDVIIPSDKVNGFKSYVESLNLQLTSFKINGVEYVS